MITAGLVDRAIDGWEGQYDRSTVKNSVSALVLVLDEAVRDGIVPRNPAKDRARRRTMGIGTGDEVGANPRDLALPDVATLDLPVVRVVEAGGHRSYGDLGTMLASTALRISEVSEMQVGGVDLEFGLLTVARQTYPDAGLVTKQTFGRSGQAVPIIAPLKPTLERLTAGRQEDALLVKGPRGGVTTTATMRHATSWDDFVRDLGLAGLVRHGLGHTALTWMADAGVELHLLQRVAGSGPGRDGALPAPGPRGGPRGRTRPLGLVGPAGGRSKHAYTGRPVRIWSGGHPDQPRQRQGAENMKNGSDLQEQVRADRSG